MPRVPTGADPPVRRRKWADSGAGELSFPAPDFFVISGAGDCLLFSSEFSGAGPGISGAGSMGGKFSSLNLSFQVAKYLSAEICNRCAKVDQPRAPLPSTAAPVHARTQQWQHT